MRDSCIIEQPKLRTTTFGLRSFPYGGAQVWNQLPTYLKEMTDLNDFKSLLVAWNGKDLIDTTLSYLWYTVFDVYKTLQSLHCLILSHASLSLFIHKHFISLMCIYICICICVYVYIYIYIYIRAIGMNPKVGRSSPPQVETFSVSKTLTLSQEHPFVCRKWMLLPAHS